MSEAMRLHSFEKDPRSYRVTLQRDLFGCWVVKCEWGNCARHSIQRRVMPADSYDAALVVLAAVIKRRVQRSYRTIVAMDA